MSTMMRITQVITSLNPTGPLKIIEEIIKIKKNINFHILVIGKKSKKEIYIPSNVHVTYTNSRYNIFKILYFIFNINAHIFHRHGFRSMFFVGIYKFLFFRDKQISIYTSHSDIFSEFHIEYGSIKSIFLTKIK